MFLLRWTRSASSSSLELVLFLQSLQQTILLTILSTTNTKTAPIRTIQPRDNKKNPNMNRVLSQYDSSSGLVNWICKYKMSWNVMNYFDNTDGVNLVVVPQGVAEVVHNVGAKDGVEPFRADPRKLKTLGFPPVLSVFDGKNKSGLATGEERIIS